jgi:hypothetical protein
MAVPGFSVSDLIQALGQAKTVYDAFFNEYTNSAAQLHDLKDELEQFQFNLQEHERILKEHGLTYSGIPGVERTIDAFNRFLDKYRPVFDSRRSVTGIYRVAKLVFDMNEVENLQGRIARHQRNLSDFKLNIIM